MIDYTRKGTFDVYKAFDYNDSLFNDILSKRSTINQVQTSNKQLTAEALELIVARQNTRISLLVVLLIAVSLAMTVVVVVNLYRRKLRKTREAINGYIMAQQENENRIRRNEQMIADLQHQIADGQEVQEQLEEQKLALATLQQQTEALKSENVGKLIDFIRGSELLIHNAKFDVGFMDKEWMLLGLDERTSDMATVVDTVSLAMKLCPGRQVNLDNLCNLFDVDRSARSLHGALLDAQILAEVYLAMTGGQSSLDFSEISSATSSGFVRPQGIVLPEIAVDEKSHASHVDMMIEIAFNKPFKKPEGQPPLSGCYWSDDYCSEYPVKGEEEPKKEYKKRLNDAIEKMHKKILSEQQLKVLDEYLNEEKKAYKEWEDRVMGK